MSIRVSYIYFVFQYMAYLQLCFTIYIPFRYIMFYFGYIFQFTCYIMIVHVLVIPNSELVLSYLIYMDGMFSFAFKRYISFANIDGAITLLCPDSFLYYR